MRTATATAIGRAVRDDNGNERWPGIVSRFQLVLLAGRKSKQLLHGARPRISADPTLSMAVGIVRDSFPFLPLKGRRPRLNSSRAMLVFLRFSGLPGPALLIISFV